jgi:hypothetical protein
MAILSVTLFRVVDAFTGAYKLPIFSRPSFRVMIQLVYPPYTRY